jgi:aminomethyltransferase
MAPRETPFHRVGLAAGAEMRDLFGYALPWQYARGHVDEHLATRERVSICDLDYMAEFRIQGPEAARFVQHLLTNDFADLAVGQIRYTAMCNREGGMVDDGTLWRMGEQEFVLITGNQDDGAWISEQADGFGVEVSDITSAWTTLAVQGPRSQEVVEALVGSEQVEPLRYYHFIRSHAAGSECILARMGYTGEKGYEFHVHPDAAERLWHALLDAGRDEDILPCGQAALESLRQEAGYLLVGNEHDAETNPLEAGIGRVVRFDKPDFVGREALAVVRRNGVRRSLVWLRLDDQSVVETGDEIAVGGVSIGRVTSGSFSPTFGRGVGMAYVQPNHAIPGLGVTVGTKHGERSGTVFTMPLYDPGDVRTRTPLPGR